MVDYVATGGYALRAYERFAKILRGPDGLWRVRDARIAQHYRMNVGTIVEAAKVKVRLGRALRGKPGTVLPKTGRVLGEIEEDFAETLTAGRHLPVRRRGPALRGPGRGRGAGHARAGPAPTRRSPPMPARSSRSRPSWPRGSARSSPTRSSGTGCRGRSPTTCCQQRRRSVLPGERDLLVETFPRGKRHYLTAFPFEGRLAHQTLGMLLTRRLERDGLRPLGFAANDYGIAIWTTRDVSERDRAAIRTSSATCSRRTCSATTSRPGSTNPP